MTDTSMTLTEMRQQTGNGDVLRTLAEHVLQILMQADVEGRSGAGR